MSLNQTNISFKTLLNKRFTTPEREFYQEDGASTLNIHITDVWADIISDDPDTAVLSGIAEYYNKHVLTPDPVYPENAFFFMINMGSFVAGIDDYETGVLNNAQQTGFISDKYGKLYTVQLYSYDNILISKTNKIGWIFNYATGVLHISNPGSYLTPYKISVYRYTGVNIPASGESAKKFNLTNKNLSALITVADGDLACLTGILQSPLMNSGIRVYVNNVRVESGNTINDLCYFSDDGGITKRAFGLEHIGDLLYWVGSVANYQLETSDLITFDYLVD